MNEDLDFLSVAQQAALSAGNILLEGFSQDAGIDADEGKDIKTQADKAAEAAVLDQLVPTGLPILSEEAGPLSLKLSDPERALAEETFWVIDPLDGTMNFTRGLPMCCVSVGLWSKGAPVLGAVYEFPADQMVSGVVGRGATVNGTPIQVSDVSDLEKSVLFTGFPSARDYSDQALLQTVRDAQQFKKVRMIGSAASSLFHVAQGHGEVYREEGIWLWDVAAGLALVRAAGGAFSLGPIQPSWQLDVTATNGHIPM